MNDYLSRQPFIKLLKNIIENQSKNNNGYSIAIDGDWGSGKTWILDALESQLSSDEYLIFHYNAWENDFYEEPLVALLSVMIEKLNEVAKQKSLYESVVTELLKEAASDLEILAVGIAKYFIKN
ncbi:MAG: KAP family NTPase [Treponema succinifaciens]|nr:MAG: KAP family NTPase [Treponema succinifaciens]